MKQTQKKTIQDQRNITGDDHQGGGKRLPAPGENSLQQIANTSAGVRQFKDYQAMADEHVAGRQPTTGSSSFKNKTILQSRTGRQLQQGNLGSFAAVVQRKKAKTPDKELKKVLENISVTEEGDQLGESIPKGSLPEVVGAAVWAFLDKNFDVNLKKGNELFKNLNENITGLSNPEKKEGKEKELTALDAKNAAHFASEYTATPAREGDSNIVTMSSIGKDPGKAAIPGKEAEYVKVRDKRAADGRTHDYKNEMNPETGKITANYNFQDHDMARFGPQGKLNNSEIIWNQYKAAAMELYKGEGERVATSMKKISQITRDEIVNGNTMGTIYMVSPTMKDAGKKQNFAPGTEEFLALLGTPNGRSSGHMLADHAHELGKTISNIETRGDKMTVSFAAVPELHAPPKTKTAPTLLPGTATADTPTEE